MKKRSRRPSIATRLRRDPTAEVVRRFFESLDTPTSLSCWLLFKHGEHRQLAEKTLDPSKYCDSEEFYLDYLAVRFLTKATFLSTGIDTQAVAVEEFLRCERKCQVVNDQLTDLFIEDPVLSLNSNADWRFSRIVSWLSCKISSVLGPLNWEAALDASNFGPGSTSRVGGTKTSVYEKFRGTPHSTHEALPYVLAISEAWENFPHVFEAVAGNTVTFVPKSAKTDRPIAIEPCMNSFIQKGLGRVIQSRLRSVGVDIRDQTLNQQHAYQGSLSGTLATVDLKSASDLLSISLIELLLPEDWFEVLNAFRSHRFTLDGSSWVKFNKFSSMGNGFTFPLQTLIFWALASLACKLSNVGSSSVVVYGDDCIVPVEAFETFCRLLNLFGMEPNSSKSYASGYFRESCGKDYFAGKDCQPLYLKEPLFESVELVKFANRLRRLSHRGLAGHGCDRRWQTLWHYCVAQLPRTLQRCRIPDGYGDGGVVVSFEEACPQRAPAWLEGFLYTRWVFRPQQYEMVDEVGTLRYALFSAQGIKSPPGGWMVNGRTPDDDHEEIRDRSYDIHRDIDAKPHGDPKGHVKAKHRSKGEWVRRTGVARNWPSLGGWI